MKKATFSSEVHYAQRNVIGKETELSSMMTLFKAHLIQGSSEDQLETIRARLHQILDETLNATQLHIEIAMEHLRKDGQ